MIEIKPIQIGEFEVYPLTLGKSNAKVVAKGKTCPTCGAKLGRSNKTGFCKNHYQRPRIKHQQ